MEIIQAVFEVLKHLLHLKKKKKTILLNLTPKVKT